MLKKVVVTGGAGFVGSHVVERLIAEDYQVYIIDDFSTGKISNISHLKTDNIKIINCDIFNKEVINIISDICPDSMILLAAQPSVAVSQKKPLKDAQSNLLGLVNLLEAARGSGCKKIVFAASGGTLYGEVSKSKLPLGESSKFKPCSFYGLTKMTAVYYLELYKRHFNIDYAALALGNVYGPRQCPDGESGVVAIFLEKMLNGQECIVNGDGLTTRDFVYVEDVARAFCNAIIKGSGLINISTGVESSVLDIYHILSKAMGAPSKRKHVEQLPGEVRHISLCNMRALDELGWSPEYSLESGIYKTKEYYNV